MNAFVWQESWILVKFENLNRKTMGRLYISGYLFLFIVSALSAFKCF